MSWEWRPETPEEIAEHQRMRDELIKCRQMADNNSKQKEQPRSRSWLLWLIVILFVIYIISNGGLSILKL